MAALVVEREKTVGEFHVGTYKKLKETNFRKCSSENDLLATKNKWIDGNAYEFRAQTSVFEDVCELLWLKEGCDTPNCVLDNCEKLCIVENEESIRLNRARQTIDFVERNGNKLVQHKPKTQKSVWQALSLLGKRVVKADSNERSISLLQLSFEIAEACRKRFPDEEWLHLVGLVHNLGHVLLLEEFGSHPVWAVTGETFPVGCKFSPLISFSHYFSSNPDRRKRVINEPLGVYQPKCGLENMLMSWSSYEYLYTTLLLQRNKLPAEALFLLRYQNFFSLTQKERAYEEFLSDRERDMIPWLEEFQKIVDKVMSTPFSKEDLCEPTVQSIKYYDELIEKYLPQDLHLWSV